MLIHKFFRVSILVIISATSWLRAQVLVTELDDIQYWIGSGANRAGMVIDWNDGQTPASFAWGYRWDGAATGEDMIRAIAGFVGPASSAPTSNPGGDPALTLFTISFSFGNAVDQIQYSAPGGLTYDKGGFDPASTGYWSYWVGGPSASLPSWNSSMVGMGGRDLVDGSWDGWSWAADFVDTAPDQPISAVPEPGVFVLLAAAGLIWFAFRSRLRFVRR